MAKKKSNPYFTFLYILNLAFIGGCVAVGYLFLTINGFGVVFFTFFGGALACLIGMITESYRIYMKQLKEKVEKNGN